MGLSLKSIWTYKCPRCRKGDMFTKPFKMTDPLDMPEACEVCGQKMLPEPGFYYGAMFISYILSGWFILIPTLILVLGYDWSVPAGMGVALLIAALTYFRFLRGSRALWMHLMIKYNPHFAIEKSKAITQTGNE